MTTIVLRDVMTSDLPVFFEQQRDEEANYMAAYGAKDPTDREAFMAHWMNVLNDVTIIKRTILTEDGQLAGNISQFEQLGEIEVGYWIGKEFWGNGIATAALQAFLEQTKTRPLYARVVKDNVASRRVLEKCGFTIIGEDKGFVNARHQEVEEYICKLG